STGHGEVNFPVLIPETEFQKEADHVKGFEGDVFWVTRGGLNELDVRLVLRPTSETAMYPMFRLWIRSHADLPLKVYQIVPVFRYETKMTRTFMRVREIHFFEAHTAHATYEDAEQQIQEDLQINERIMRLLCLPYLISRRPDWDKFAKVYDVTYETEKGEHRYVYQTTDGMSERLLGATISIHGDEKGLVLPPAAAPVQAVVVPILEKGRQEEMLLEAQRLFLELRERMRVRLDDRDIRPGEKYYEWEARGVPLRVELGPRDLAKNVITAVRRDLHRLRRADETGPVRREGLLRRFRRSGRFGEDPSGLTSDRGASRRFRTRQARPSPRTRRPTPGGGGSTIRTWHPRSRRTGRPPQG